MSTPIPIRNRLRRAGLPTALALVFIAAQVSVAAQLSKEELLALAAKEPDVKAILRGQSIPAGQEQLFDDFFNNYFLPQFASETASTHDNLPRLRKQLRIFFQTGKSGAAHERLNDLTLKKMISILKAKDKDKDDKGIDSVAKCNATLIIGELNEQEMNPVKPYAQAFNALMIVLKTPKFFKDEVRVAALVGVERFAAYGAIPADKKAAVTALLMEQLKQATPPPGRTLAGHNWLRRNAAQILAALGSPGPDNGVVTAIESIVADPQGRITLRCEMAQYLGQLKYPAGAKIDYEGLAGLIGHQTVDICSKEVESVTSNSQFLSTTEDARLHRFLTYVAHCSLQALEGPDGKSGLLAGAAQDPNRDFVDSVRGKLKGLYTSLEGAETTDLVDVRNRLTELQGILPPKPAAKSEAAATAPQDKVADPKSADPKKAGTEQAAVEPPKAGK